MDPELIKAIGSLWLLALVLFLLVFVLLFRAPLRAVLARLTKIHFKKGAIEVSLIEDSKEQDATQK